MLPAVVDQLSKLIPDEVVRAVVDAVMDAVELRRREVEAFEKIAARLDDACELFYRHNGKEVGK